MRGGWNAERRSRKIGAARKASPQRQLTLPSAARRTRGLVVDQRAIHGQPITFFTEPTRPGFHHACSIPDILTVLAALPADDLTGLTSVVFQQLSRKERTVAPRWGHLSFDKEGDDATLFLASTLPGDVLLWGTSLLPADVAELDRLKSEGHEVQLTERGWEITSTIAAARLTQLQRTVPHEIGHWVDHQAASENGRAKVSYAAKEAAAEQYAARMHDRVGLALMALSSS